MSRVVEYQASTLETTLFVPKTVGGGGWWFLREVDERTRRSGHTAVMH